MVKKKQWKVKWYAQNLHAPLRTATLKQREQGGQKGHKGDNLLQNKNPDKAINNQETITYSPEFPFEVCSIALAAQGLFF